MLVFVHTTWSGLRACNFQPKQVSQLLRKFHTISIIRKGGTYQLLSHVIKIPNFTSFIHPSFSHACLPYQGFSFNKVIPLTKWLIKGLFLNIINWGWIAYAWAWGNLYWAHVTLGCLITRMSHIISRKKKTHIHTPSHHRRFFRPRAAEPQTHVARSDHQRPN